MYVAKYKTVKKYGAQCIQLSAKELSPLQIDLLSYKRTRPRLPFRGKLIHINFVREVGIFNIGHISADTHFTKHLAIIYRST